MSAPPSDSATSRREAILRAALDLFRARGFHAVGIDEVGVAAGISGPGVYRHFPSKGSLLVALLDSVSERMLLAVEQIQKADLSPEQTLDRLVDYHVAIAVDQRSLLAVGIRDWRSLPAGERERLRGRQADYLAVWLQTLVLVRPELGPGEAEGLVHAALAAVHSCAFHDTGLPPGAVRALLGKAARAVLRTA